MLIFVILYDVYIFVDYFEILWILILELIKLLELIK